MPEQIFTGLSVIVAIVLVVLWVMKFFKQPLMIGYIIAGTLISIFFPSILHGNSAFESFSTIGISLLLFMVGLELNPKIIKDMGKSSLIIGILQVVITALVGWALARWLGFDLIPAIYLWVAFAFSSTIVVLKLIGDQEETETEHGRLSIGILIVQDIIVLVMFLIIATIKNNTDASSFTMVLETIGKIMIIATGFWIMTKYIIPIITKKIAESQEYLFLFAVGRCFIRGTIFQYAGFWMEIGTLLAGISLANSNYRFEIMSRVKSLRDFFIVLFFVLLGSKVHFAIWRQYIPKLLIFLGFIMIIKPTITMIIAGFMKHTKKVSFLTGFSLGQISEFSFLLISMGIANGFIQDNGILSTITLLWLLTIAGSSYFILYGKKIYEKCHICSRIFKVFPFGTIKRFHEHDREFDTMLIGYGRFGQQLYQSLNQHKKILVIDQDPEVIIDLQKEGIPCVYGDMGDMEFIKELGIKGIKMIISTIPNYDDNMLLVKTAKYIDKEIIVVLVCNHVEQSIQLYEAGADYVIVPHYIGASHTSMMLEDYGFDLHKFTQNKSSQIYELKNHHKKWLFDILNMKE